MTREEPSLETLWLKNFRTVDKVQIIDHSNTALLSKTFRNEMKNYHIFKLEKLFFSVNLRQRSLDTQIFQEVSQTGVRFMFVIGTKSGRC
jgi:hypothetical protein